MASQKVIALALMSAKAAMPHIWKDVDIKAMATTFALLFKEVPDESFSQAYFRVLQNAKYPPTPGEVTAELKKTAKKQINISVEWDALLDACEKVNDLRTEFGYTYIPTGETRSQGQMARDEAKNVFASLQSPLKEYLGSFSSLLQFAQEIAWQDEVGLSIRRRDYEQHRKKTITESSYAELENSLQGDQNKAIIGHSGYLSIYEE